MKYWKCQHGNRKIMKITKGAKDNTSSVFLSSWASRDLFNKLHRASATCAETFQTAYRLFQVLYKCDGPPTPDELELARGSKLMTDDIAVEYAKQADQLRKNIKEMFAKQAATAEVNIHYSILRGCIANFSCQEPWDQQHFEDLVAKWVAVCDQPFTAVNAPECREMLQYAHRKLLHIPHDQSVKVRIQTMLTDLEDALKQIFAVWLRTNHK
jgi:hypothetical protein